MLAEARLAAYARELGEEPEVVATYTGRDLLGMRYLPPFPYFMDSPNAFQVLPGDFVTTEDGTGIVHMAPAYGEDDMATADRPRTSWRSRRWTPRAASTRRCPTTRASTSSTPTRRSSAT